MVNIHLNSVTYSFLVLYSILHVSPFIWAHVPYASSITFSITFLQDNHDLSDTEVLYAYYLFHPQNIQG